jgi:hypothetical protein
MQTDAMCIENLLMIIMFLKKAIKKHRSKETLFKHNSTIVSSYDE